ncbi:Protein MAK16-like protein [Coemansia spiralis]|uniref:Protein MAK16 n=2 Tax=Coemansia TaxID=4863 RepID=A0A9W8KYI5_9FUNG|nr:ribosomal L28e protein family-domain-containing protein [Coemansia spiralis]KAJ1990055.1 Protein MAK16-like protein [Coemansia umbellata]KAJ2622144.1 Protein MAK16-like protein [Coemansia sp. RSA 1358]KAJ2678355.1 Protein MAK16-like protein [Coemansia spiralis]
MNNDGLVWEVLNNQFCSYKVKTDVGNLCRHPYNLTGMCNRRDCPLANSKYATVRETGGHLYLCIKTAERAHLPAKQWQKVKLPKNFAQAVEVIDKHMQYWPNWMKHMCKQRLTKITQYLIRMRKLKLKNKHTLVPIKKKLERREKSREIRAEAAARLDQSIEKELLQRLKSKAYGDQPLNVNESVWNEILEGDAVEAESDVTTEDELEEDEEEREIEYEEEGDGFGHDFVLDDSDIDEDEDIEDFRDMNSSEISSGSEDEGEYMSSDDDAEDTKPPSDAKGKSKRSAEGAPRPKPTKRTKRSGPRVEVEYETETPAQDGMLTNW